MDRLSTLYALVRVIDTGSFSAAARQLRIGQPAVSKAIAQLERRLGVPLLLRSSRKLTPTGAGRQFCEHARRAIEEVEEAEHTARGTAAGLSGTLKFAAAVTFARLHVMPRLPAFLADHPALRVEAILDDRPVDLIEQGVDVALRLGRLVDSSHVARRIGRCRHLVVGSPSYFEHAGKPARPSDLSGHRGVVYGNAVAGAWRFTKGGREESVRLPEHVRSTAMEGLREAVFAGLGLAIASEWAFQPDLGEGRIERVLADWNLPPLDVHAVFPSGRRASAKAQAFVRFVEDELRSRGFGRP